MLHHFYGLDFNSPYFLSGISHGLKNEKAIEIKTGKHFEESLLRHKKDVVFSHGRHVSLTGINDGGRKVIGIRYQVEDDFGFDLDLRGRVIYYFPLQKHSLDRYRFWLLKSIVPFFLNGIGTYNFLHAGAVAIHNKAVLFIGPPFAGKSTLVNFMVKKGCRLITDDFLGINSHDNKFWGIPSFPFVRPSRMYEHLGEQVSDFSYASMEIGKIFFLSFTEPEAAVEITPAPAAARLLQLLDNSAKLQFRLREQFDFFVRMSREVPIYTIGIPKDIQRLPDVYKELTASVYADESF